MDLQAETTEVLQRLIRFDTVNPPGRERECQEWLKAYLEEAGLEVELAGAHPDRPNLVARLPGEQPGPVLGYASHVDTVLADAQDWSHDPWSGEVSDGFVFGRGALDMKNQTAAEVVAAANLARQGWRPARGELKVLAIVDEETGGAQGIQWLARERPDLAACDYLINEGAGAPVDLPGRRVYGVAAAEKGVLRFGIRAAGVAAHASVPGFGDNALLKLAPVIERLGRAQPPRAANPHAQAMIDGLGVAVEDLPPQLASLVQASLGITLAPTVISASEKINVIPARAELQVDCRMPPGMTAAEALPQIEAILGDVDGLSIEVTEETVGNSSAIDSPLFSEIERWLGEEQPGASVVPFVLPAFTDSRTWRDAFPDCVAYGFMPLRHMTLLEWWPLLHARDERADVRDLGFAAEFFHALPGRLLA